MISSEAPLLFAKAAQIFITEVKLAHGIYYKVYNSRGEKTDTTLYKYIY